MTRMVMQAQAKMPASCQARNWNVANRCRKSATHLLVLWNTAPRPMKLLSCATCTGAFTTIERRIVGWEVVQLY